MRVAIVHYWFTARRGGEKVVEALAEMFPQADLFALVVDREALGPSLRDRKITTSFLQRLPNAAKWHRYLLPLYPFAVEQFDLRGYDLVLSSESGPAKGVITGADTCHICYCHSPMRYLWDMYHDYAQETGLSSIKKQSFLASAHYVRMWDLASSYRVDRFVANSHNVARRIRKHYRREAVVVYPPVDTEKTWISTDHEGYYLCVGQLVDYKRVDLAIEVCNRLSRPLHIVGGGEQLKNLQKLGGPTVHFLGSLTDEELRQQYAGCRALIFPGNEDFGIVPVEAQAFGKPVIAYGRGGCLETVLGVSAPAEPDGSSTGIFFEEQTVESLIGAINVYESYESRFAGPVIRANAQRFGGERFKEEMRGVIESELGTLSGLEENR